MTCDPSEGTRARARLLAMRPCAGRSFLAGAFAMAAKEGALRALYRSCLHLQLAAARIRSFSPRRPCRSTTYLPTYIPYIVLCMYVHTYPTSLLSLVSCLLYPLTCSVHLFSTVDTLQHTHSATTKQTYTASRPLQIRHYYYSVVRGCFLAPITELLRCLIASAQVR